MRKLLLFITSFAITLMAGAQSLQIDNLKKELNNHKYQDTIRVNLLNDLAYQSDLKLEERKANADEALAISKRIKYVKGQGFAYLLLGTIEVQMKNLSESKSMFLRADSIANATGNLDLKANVLWRRTETETDSGQKDNLLQQAYTLAIKAGEPALQAKILGAFADNTTDELKQKALYLQADSIAQKIGDHVLQARINYNLGINAKDLREQKAFFKKAISLAEKSGDLYLQTNLLWAFAINSRDKLEQKLLYLQADSTAQKSGDLALQARLNYSIGLNTNDLQKREAIFKKVISLIEKSGDLSILVDWSVAIAGDLASTGNKNAINYYLKAEETAQKSGDNAKLSAVRNSIGNYYMSNLSDYARTMEFYLKALSTAETANDTIAIINSWISLGVLYTYMGDWDNSLSYLLKAESANKKLGDKSIESVLQNSFGENYRLSGKYAQAIMAYNKSMELRKVLNPDYNNYLNESNLADVYTRMGILDSAFYYGFKSLKIVKEVGNISTQGWVDGILSRAYLKKNMADSAIYYGKSGLAAAKESGTIEFMRDNTLALANAYAAKKDFANAYANHLLYINYRDSMVNEEVRNRTAVQQYTFNLDKKETQINVLHEQRKGQRNLLIGAVFLLALILAVAGLLLRNNHQKRKANRLLEQQKQEIDEKAQELATQKENVELLSDIGRKITSSLSIEKIIGTVYKSVNTLMDANVFGIGIYNDTMKQIEFPATYENGEPLPFYSNSIEDENRFGTVCFNEGKEIIINNLDEKYKNHLQEVATPDIGGQPVSIIFLPLIAKDEKLGVITVQSFKENAYSEYQLFMLQNIATYTAIALENAASYETLKKTFSTLKTTQTQLIQKEKMASLGELTAGIAHEIQNPLNFVNNFSELNKEMINEMQTELLAGNTEEAVAISNDIKNNEEKINHHGRRADAIVKGMLQHSGTTTGKNEPTDINALADEYLKLGYHGLRAKNKSFNAILKTDFDESIGKINIVPQDIGRVLLNLFNNAFYSVNEQESKNPISYEPTITVSTSRSLLPGKGIGGEVIITVSDNGNGVPQKNVEKIFQPFFTTKPTGQGTGLGLSLSYDIIKAHGGELKVESKEGEGSTFIIQLPVI